MNRSIYSGLAARDTLRDAHSNAVGRLAEQDPQHAYIAPRKGSHDIHGCIAYADREDLGCGRHAEKGVAEGQDAATVGGGTFWEQHNRSIGILLDQG